MSGSFKRIWQVFLIRNREFYRDKGAMGWTFVFPVLMIVAFGYMFDLGDQGQFKVGIFSEGNVKKVEMLDYVEYQTQTEALEKLRHQQLDLVIDWEQDPPRYWTATENPKSLIAEKLFLNEFLFPSDQMPIKEEVKGRRIKYIDWLFPGLLTMNVLWMALWGVGWVIVRQRKIGVLKRLKASPMRPHEYLLAQILSRLLVLIVSGGILFIGSHFIYPFHTEGSYLDLFVMYILGVFALSSIGLIIAARMTSEEFANGLINLLTYPMMFLSEIWFTLEGSGEWVKTAAKFSPLWHMTNGMRQIMNEGKNLADLWSSVILLIIISIVFTTIGSLSFRWTKET